MTAQDIITLARDLTHTTSTQISDEQINRYLNIAYHELENEIVQKVNEDYFWDFFITDTVENQNEYTLPISSSTTEWVKKVISVWLKRTQDDTEYTKINSDSSSNFSHDIDYLKDNLSPTNSYFEVKEWSIFIYPTVEESVINWLKIESIVTLKDISNSATETDIFPNQSALRQFHYSLAIWIKQFIYSQQKEFWEKDNAIQEWQLEKQKVIDYLQDRVNTPAEWYLPEWTNLMY